MPSSVARHRGGTGPAWRKLARWCNYSWKLRKLKVAKCWKQLKRIRYSATPRHWPEAPNLTTHRVTDLIFTMSVQRFPCVFPVSAKLVRVVSLTDQDLVPDRAAWCHQPHDQRYGEVDPRAQKLWVSNCLKPSKQVPVSCRPYRHSGPQPNVIICNWLPVTS